MTQLAPKLALAAVAAVALYIPTLGLPLTDPCMRTGSVASAAPSPTCAGDLRDCLRLSAKQGLYGVRYVTADDVARCMEAFNSCIHGGASKGGNQAPPNSTSQPGGDNGKALPQRFTMSFQGFASDCRVSGETVSCTSTLEPRPADIDFFQSTFTGSLSGMTVSGTETRNQKGHYPNGCTYDENYSTPSIFTFESGGSVRLTFSTGQRQSRFSCDEATSGTTPAGEVSGTWSAIG